MKTDNTKSNTEIGRIGEHYATEFLISHNYEILERNWRFKKAEIDIIALLNNCLIFIEVKAKTYTSYGQPEESISEKKEAMIMDAAQRYMESINYEWEVRFDIISIILSKSHKLIKIEHFQDAFF